MLKESSKEFPMNRLGLSNNTHLKAKRDIPLFNIKAGDEFGMFWDGEKVCMAGLSWAIKYITEEIDAGYWEIIKY